MDIDKSLLKTLSDSDLKPLTQSYAEIALDSQLTTGVLKDIPIVRTVAGLASLGTTIRDRLFLKKVLRFLAPLSELTVKQRRQFLGALNQKEKTKAVEYMVVYIDRLESIDKADMLGRVFSAYLSGRITYKHMLYFAHFIDKVFFLVWEDYFTAIKKWHDSRGGSPKIYLDDVRALEVVGFYVEISPPQRILIGTRYVETLSTDVTLKLSDAGWKFIQVVFGLWNDNSRPHARAFLSVKVPRNG
ncbi:MAG: hypothetical protein HY292_01305 [Planctomycetes bacterium]|nr:hypothetical protein [Planctomycetota bacterium]